jgi:hypothetical protein
VSYLLPIPRMERSDGKACAVLVQRIASFSKDKPHACRRKASKE